ncbi:MAG TPA: hypothetical protein VFB19_07955 [Mycobacterium sp.]|nr:hypothetical protein [Mycobacterium sp.]
MRELGQEPVGDLVAAAVVSPRRAHDRVDRHVDFAPMMCEQVRAVGSWRCAVVLMRRSAA